MVAVPRGQEKNINMSFLVLRDSKKIFEGTAEEMVKSKDPYLREYLS
jgi:ABC-type transporter Mla maintaining outer membrane lipid asymmetry ATPase subunit MlaF